MRKNDFAPLLREIDVHHDRHFPGHGLRPIPGGGQHVRPEAMFVFINPTAANVSASPGWEGMRAPFIGTRAVWRIFHQAGLIDDSLADEIAARKAWDVRFAEKVYGTLAGKGYYLTNLVKWAGHDAALPRAALVNLYLPILMREIAFVEPRRIIAFGLMPFGSLTKTPIRLADVHAQMMREGKTMSFPCTIKGRKYPVIPCYFPVGRGNPKRAVEILALLEKELARGT